MDGAVIELDSLPDADRPGAQHQHLPAALFLPVFRHRRKARPDPFCGKPPVSLLLHRQAAVSWPFIGNTAGLAFSAVHRVIIGCGSGKLCGTSIHHFVHCPDSVCMAHPLDLVLRSARKPADNSVWKLQPLCLPQKLRGQLLSLQSLLHFHQNSYLVQKPYIDPCNLMDFIQADPLANGLCNQPDTPIVCRLQLLL